MDHTYDASFKAKDEVAAAKQRFESFKLGKSLPAVAHGLPRPSHGRSHSRNTSISSVSSLSFSSSTNSIKSTNDMVSHSSTSSSIPSATTPKRPNSHHRRRSSVSTRRESAEMMGVSLPDLPISISDDSLSLGDKDSIRRRALLALEGKTDIAFSKVEIPELYTPDMEKPFEFPTKPSFPPGFGFGGNLNNLMNKRDSFGKLLTSSSSKDQLQTLVEEEEEEEESEPIHSASKSFDFTAETPRSIVSVSREVTKASPARPRPVSLNLRPLSLIPDALVGSASGNLPTPSPSPRPFGLKTLTLASSFVVTPAKDDNTLNSSTSNQKRQSLFLGNLPTPPSSGSSFGRPSLIIDCGTSPSPISLDERKPKRASSISYKSSADTRSPAALPTPGATPTSAEDSPPRTSTSSGDEESFHHRPLSVSEQHFLFKSHNALLARITDMERALAAQSRSLRSRPHSRPLSFASDTSSNATSEPSDEMLQLIADLKAERDELKRDVDGWRTRVSDLQKQVDIFAKRVEGERRDAWVARSRVGLLEMEKTGLEKSLFEKAAAAREAANKFDALEVECTGLKSELVMLRSQLKDKQGLEEECSRLRTAWMNEKKKREDLEKLLDGSDPLATPTASVITTRTRGLGFRSMDSEGSFTDVESVDGGFIKADFPLKAVVEEEEDVLDDNASDMTDEGNGLAGYEDEQDSDMSFRSEGGSSISSADDFPRSTTHLRDDGPDTLGLTSASSPPRSLLSSPAARLSHSSHASLSKTWTFPKASQVSPSLNRESEEIDRFFGCLDDLDNSLPLSSSVETSDSPFSAGFAGFGSVVDDDLPPFLIPSDVGVLAEAPTTSSLSVVLEEDEEEDEGELMGGEILNGIKFTFTPPEGLSEEREESPDVSTPMKISTPIFDPFGDDEDEDDESFTFPLIRREAFAPEACSSPQIKDIKDSPTSPRSAPSPSSIPRSTALKSFASTTSPKATSSRSPSYSPNAFVTPPTKRGGMMPSFIPQPVASPSKSPVLTKPRRPATFIRQPQRKPVPTNSPGVPHGSTKLPLKLSTPTYSFHDFAADETVNAPRSSNLTSLQSPRSYSVLDMFSPAVEIDGPATPSSLSALMSSTTRLSLQTITNFIPLSWGPRPSTAFCDIPRTSSQSNAVDKWTATPQASEVNRQFVASKTEKRYVSRESQLQKLRSRLEQENSICPSCRCKGCSEELFCL